MLGTKRKWLAWFILSLTYIISMLLRNVSGVLQKELMMSFDLNVADYGLLASIYMYAFTAMQFVVGPMLDIKGARVTVTSGMFIAGAGTIIFGCSPNVSMLFLGRILIAVGFAGAFASCVKVSALNFEPAVFATVVGMTSFLGQVGALISQTPFAFFCELLGWRLFFGIIGGLTILLGAFIWKHLKNNEEKDSEKQPFGLKSVFNKDILRELRTVVKIPYMKHVIANAFGGFGIITMLIAAWCVPFLRDVYGISLMESTNIMVFLLVGQMIGCLTLGCISDKLRSRKKVYVVSTLITTIIFLKVFFIPPLVPYEYIKPLFFVFGITSCNYVIRVAIAKEICGAEHSGCGFTLPNAGVFFGAAVTTTVTGMIFKWSSGIWFAAAAYRIAFIPTAAAVIAAGVMTFIIPETFGKNK